MTTILKALQELERHGAPAAQPDASRVDRDGRLWRGATAVVVALAVLGSVVGLMFVRPRRDTAVPVEKGASATLPQARGAPQQPARVPPLLTSPVQGDRPWGFVGKTRPAAPAAAMPAVPPAPAVAPSGRPRQEALAPKAGGGTTSAPGEPHVQVKSIAYSPAAAQRSVTLRVEGASPVTLREGESANGIEVQLILPDSVYLRHGGSVFAVGATPG